MEFQYLTDAAGKPHAVVLPIDLWRDIFPTGNETREELIDGIEDYCLGKAMDEAAADPTLDREAALRFLEED